VPEVDAIVAAAAAANKHNNQLVHGRISLGEWHRSSQSGGERGGGEIDDKSNKIDWLGGN
jgi:hypothetical protein